MSAHRTVFTFATTHHALWAEELAQQAGIAAEAVPAPPAARARCSIALETMPGDALRLRVALEAEGVTFEVWGEAD
jgi:hypothetical protein